MHGFFPQFLRLYEAHNPKPETPKLHLCMPLKPSLPQGLVLRRLLADYQPQRVLYVGDAGFVFQKGFRV